MQCSACGTQLPVGAAYCPTCGSVTPYNVSSSGVSPSDPTVASFSYAEPSQKPYTPPNPYTAPPPPPPPADRRRPSASKIVLLIVLVLLIVGAGSLLRFRMALLSGQTQSHASPTTQAQQATTTPSAQTPQDLYDQVTQNPPTLNDPLSTNDTNNWTESTSAEMRC